MEDREKRDDSMDFGDNIDRTECFIGREGEMEEFSVRRRFWLT